MKYDKIKFSYDNFLDFMGSFTVVWFQRIPVDHANLSNYGKHKTFENDNGILIVLLSNCQRRISTQHTLNSCLCKITKSFS